jgi:hypothetical protein
MKKIFLLLMTAIIFTTTSFAQTFSDLPEGHWAKGSVEEMVKAGIISGYTDGTFRPNGEVTKAELVTILNKINNDEQNVTKKPSKDVKLTDWYCVDMAIGLKNGLIELDDNGNLNPKSVVTREEAITMIAKLFNLKYTGNTSSITDALKVIGAESSFIYRKNIAKVNNIANYTGTATQNIRMLELLKNGTLLKP